MRLTASEGLAIFWFSPTVAGFRQHPVGCTSYTSSHCLRRVWQEGPPMPPHFSRVLDPVRECDCFSAESPKVCEYVPEGVQTTSACFGAQG